LDSIRTRLKERRFHLRKTLFTVLVLAFLFSFSGKSSAQDFIAGALTAQAAACPTNPGNQSASTSAIALSAVNKGGATFTIGSTAFSGTVGFYASGDGGTTWVALNVTPSNSTTAVTTATAAGLWQANVAAYTHVCMVVTSYGSGTVTATIRGSTVSARAGGGGGGGSGLPAGCASGTNPEIQCTQAANGNDTISVVRNTDTAPTGTAYNLLNAAKNAVLYSVDVLGNVSANSFQAIALGAGYFQCSNGNGTLPTLVAGQFQLTCPAGAITNYQIVVPTAAGTGPLCGTNATNVVTLAFGGCGSTAGTQYQMAYYAASGSVVAGDANIVTDAANDLSVAAALSTGSTSKLTYCTGATQSCFAGTEGGIATSDTTASTFKIVVDSTAHEAKLATNATNNYGLLDRTEPGSVNSTGLVALVSTATLCAASAGACNVAGQYHVHANIWGSGTACATPSPGGVTFSLTWTDENSVSHAAVVIPALSQSSATAVALVSSAPTMPFESALANEGASIDYTLSSSGAAAIQYAVAYTACGSGTGTYNLRASAVRVQ
jgi:hypothetical protein